MAREYKRKHNIGLCVIDYMQLMDGPRRNNTDNRTNEVTAISKSIKRLTKDLNIPILALCQLSRLADGQRPRMAHLRESGGIEQDADTVLLLHPTGEKGDLVKDGVELILEKQRNGMTGDALYWFDTDKQRFLPADTHHDDGDVPKYPTAHESAEALYGTEDGFDDVDNAPVAAGVGAGEQSEITDYGRQATEE